MKIITEQSYNLTTSDFKYERRGGVGEYSVDAKRHPYFEISYISRGEGVLQAGNRVYDLNEGDIIFISQGVSHRMMCTSPNGEVHRIACRPHSIPESVREHFKTAVPVIRGRKSASIAAELVLKIAQEYVADEKFSVDMLRAYVAELAVTAARTTSSIGDVLERSPAVASTVTYIKEHSGEKISLADMARMCKVSVAYLSRKFKEELGVGFSDYLSLSRLQRAETLLLESPEMSITEVAFSSGFNDSNYFSDKFKKQFGMSPLKFRSQSKLNG